MNLEKNVHYKDIQLTMDMSGFNYLRKGSMEKCRKSAIPIKTLHLLKNKNESEVHNDLVIEFSNYEKYKKVLLQVQVKCFYLDLSGSSKKFKEMPIKKDNDTNLTYNHFVSSRCELQVLKQFSSYNCEPSGNCITHNAEIDFSDINTMNKEEQCARFAIPISQKVYTQRFLKNTFDIACPIYKYAINVVVKRETSKKNHFAKITPSDLSEIKTINAWSHSTHKEEFIRGRDLSIKTENNREDEQIMRCFMHSKFYSPEFIVDHTTTPVSVIIERLCKDINFQHPLVDNYVDLECEMLKKGKALLQEKKNMGDLVCSAHKVKKESPIENSLSFDSDESVKQPIATVSFPSSSTSLSNNKEKLVSSLKERQDSKIKKKHKTKKYVLKMNYLIEKSGYEAHQKEINHMIVPINYMKELMNTVYFANDEDRNKFVTVFKHYVSQEELLFTNKNCEIIDKMQE